MEHKLRKWTIVAIAIPISIFSLFSFNTQSGYEPVLMSRIAMEEAVQLRENREIEKPGKIWVYNDFIFVIEKYRGIHVIDNANPSDPQNLSFIQVDGCTDVAVKDGLIYANNAVDLIGIKPAQDYQSIQVVSRNRNVIPELESPEGWSNHDFNRLRPENTVIVRWETYKP